MIRTFLAVPIEAQTVLRAFFAAAVVPRSITASLDATSLDFHGLSVEIQASILFGKNFGPRNRAT